LKAIFRLRQRGPTSPDGDNWLVWLELRVRQYADARRRACERDPAQSHYTPYPAKWFDGERYDDDPTEWTNVGAAQRGAKNGRQTDPNRGFCKGKSELPRDALRLS
jgi:hypothetical protein